MAKRTKQDEGIQPEQLFLFGDEPVVEEAPEPIAIQENWRSVGSYFVANDVDAAGEMRVVRSMEDAYAAVEAGDLPADLIPQEYVAWVTETRRLDDLRREQGLDRDPDMPPRPDVDDEEAVTLFTVNVDRLLRRGPEAITAYIERETEGPTRAGFTALMEWAQECRAIQQAHDEAQPVYPERPNVARALDTPAIEGELLNMGLRGPEMPGLSPRHVPRIRELIKIRDAARRLLYAQMANAPAAQVADLREALNAVYDAFNERYGRLNTETFTARGRRRRPNLMHFESDPDFPLVAALEVDVEQDVLEDGEDRLEKRFDKAPIFFRNTVNNDVEPTEAATPLDALNISLDRRGLPDIPYMAGLLGRQPGEVLEDLVGEIYKNPETNLYEPAAEYLSGSVRRKLRIAKAAAEQDKRWLVNVQALEGVQPEDLTVEDIIPSLGVPWIPATDIQDFIVDLLDCYADDIDLIADENQAQWTIRAAQRARRGARATRTWGTARMDAVELLDCALNQRDPIVRDRIEGTDPPRYRLNRDATLEAREKMSEIKAEFQDWLWRDNDRTVRLVREYNDLYNDQVERTYNGEHLTLPGSDVGIELMPHQKNAIWRGIQKRNTLVAHRVGWGKTWVQTGTIMEAKRLGQARKPVWIVPTSMIEDIPRQFLQMYPMARLLVPSKKDMKPANREEFLARIVTSEPDCVIMTHDQFTKLPISVDARRAVLQDEIDAVEREVPGEDRAYQLARRKKASKLRKKLEEMEGKEDSGITFEDTGIDMFVVDESQNFKNLPLFSKNRTLSNSGSKRAEELMMRVRHVNAHGGKVVFATGTPIANSIMEMYTLMHYLHNDRLRELGLDHVDAWVAMFAEPVTKFEISPSGTYEAKTRFAEFKNVPELRALFREFADVQMERRVEGMKLPEIMGGGPQEVAVEPHPYMLDFMQEALRRVEAIRAKEVTPREDNMLKVIHEVRSLANSPLLIDPNAPADSAVKIEAAADNIARIYHEHYDEGAVQLVFFDLGTPKPGDEYSVARHLTEALIARGVNPGEIAHAQDAQGEGAKEMFDAAVNSGEIRVATGSTQTLGTGRNVQRRAKAMHDLDGTWRPDGMTQRSGRADRQGNLFDVIEHYRYAVIRSFDSYIYQTLERKAAFINQVMSGDSKRRTIEDIDEVTISFKTMKAIASGDPLVQEKAELESEIARNEKLVRAERNQRYQARQDLARIPERRTRLDDLLTKIRADIAERTDVAGEAFEFTTEKGTVHKERKDAGRVLITAFALAEKRGTHGGSAVEKAGTIGGFKVSFEKVRGIAPDIIISNHGVYRKPVGKITREDGKLDDDLFADSLSALGLVDRVTNMVSWELDKRLEEMEQKSAVLDKNMANLQALIDGDTPRERALQELYVRLREVDAELGIGLADEDVPDMEEEEVADEVYEADLERRNVGDQAEDAPNGGRFINAIDQEMGRDDEAENLERIRRKTMEEARAKAKRALLGG